MKPKDMPMPPTQTNREEVLCDAVAALKELDRLIGPYPPETCPKIDRMVRDLEDADSYAKTIERDRELPDDVRSLADDIRRELASVLSALEEVRKANETLREQSKAWRTEYWTLRKETT